MLSRNATAETSKAKLYLESAAAVTLLEVFARIS